MSEQSHSPASTLNGIAHVGVEAGTARPAGILNIRNSVAYANCLTWSAKFQLSQVDGCAANAQLNSDQSANHFQTTALFLWYGKPKLG